LKKNVFELKFSTNTPTNGKDLGCYQIRENNTINKMPTHTKKKG